MQNAHTFLAQCTDNFQFTDQRSQYWWNLNDLQELLKHGKTILVQIEISFLWAKTKYHFKTLYEVPRYILAISWSSGR